MKKQSLSSTTFQKLYFLKDNIDMYALRKIRKTVNLEKDKENNLYLLLNNIELKRITN